MALGVGGEALEDARIDDVDGVATVFVSCGSDGDIVHPAGDAIHPWGGIAILRGNLAPNAAAS